MATKQIANLTVHKLSVQPLVGDTVLTWDSVAGWPTVGDFVIRLDHPSNGIFEYVKATSVNVGALQTTVTRAQEGTSASGGFIVGSTGANALTAQMTIDAMVRLDTALSQTLTGPLVIPPAIGVAAAATSYGSVPVKFAETVLGAPAASVAFSSIPSTFRVLKAKVGGTMSTGGATEDVLYTRFNNDATANYDLERHVDSTNAGAGTDTEALGTANTYSGFLGGSAGTAAFFGVTEQSIPLYAGAVGNKVLIWHSGCGGNNLTGQQLVGNGMIKWRTTATAINRLDYSASTAGNINTGATFVIYLEP